MAGKSSLVLRTVCGARINSFKSSYLSYSLQLQPPKILTVRMLKNVERLVDKTD